MASAAPPAARRRAKREGRRQRLLSAALRLFAERGYHDTSVDDIVAAARTSKSAFYEYFESKEDCVRMLLEQEGGLLMEAVAAAAAGGTGHRDRMRRGIAAFVHACAAKGPVARLLLVESVGISESIEEVRHRIHGDFAGMVEAEVRRAQPTDSVYGEVDPVVYGRAVVGAVNEATGYFLTQAGADPEAVANGLCSIFVP